MKDTQTVLLRSVKNAVAKYGLAGLTTRNIGEVSGVNDALIYHYFKDKDDLLIHAYEYESNEVFTNMLGYLDEVHGIPFSFRDKARLSFHRTWRDFLSNPERLIFVTSFYYSNFFQEVRDHHKSQVAVLIERLGKYFPSEDVCVQTMYSLMTILYDASKRVIDGTSPDTEEMEDGTFNICYSLLIAQGTNIK